MNISFHYMSVIQMTDDLYNYISSIDTLVQMNEIVLEIVFHCNFVQHMFVWFCKRWGLMHYSVHLLSIELNLYIKHLTQLVHFRVLCANMTSSERCLFENKSPCLCSGKPLETPGRLNIHRRWKTAPEHCLTACDRNIPCALQHITHNAFPSTSGQPVIWSHDHLLRGQRSGLMNEGVRTAR